MNAKFINVYNVYNTCKKIWSYIVIGVTSVIAIILYYIYYNRRATNRNRDERSDYDEQCKRIEQYNSRAKSTVERAKQSSAAISETISKIRETAREE